MELYKKNIKPEKLKFKYKNVKNFSYYSSDLETLKKWYNEKYGNVVPNLKYIKDVNKLTKITIFDNFTDGLHLLKNVNTITIIKSVHKDLSKRTLRNISKLRKINKNLLIYVYDEIIIMNGIGGIVYSN